MNIILYLTSILSKVLTEPWQLALHLNAGEKLRDPCWSLLRCCWLLQLLELAYVFVLNRNRIKFWNKLQEEKTRFASPRGTQAIRAQRCSPVLLLLSPAPYSLNALLHTGAVVSRRVETGSLSPSTCCGGGRHCPPRWENRCLHSLSQRKELNMGFSAPEKGLSWCTKDGQQGQRRKDDFPKEVFLAVFWGLCSNGCEEDTVLYNSSVSLENACTFALSRRPITERLWYQWLALKWA